MKPRNKSIQKSEWKLVFGWVLVLIATNSCGTQRHIFTSDVVNEMYRNERWNFSSESLMRIGIKEIEDYKTDASQKVLRIRLFQHFLAGWTVTVYRVDDAVIFEKARVGRAYYLASWQLREKGATHRNLSIITETFRSKRASDLNFFDSISVNEISKSQTWREGGYLVFFDNMWQFEFLDQGVKSQFSTCRFAVEEGIDGPTLLETLRWVAANTE